MGCNIEKDSRVEIGLNRKEYPNRLVMSAMGAGERVLACVSRVCYLWTRLSLRFPLNLSDIIIMIMEPDLL